MNLCINEFNVTNIGGKEVSRNGNRVPLKQTNEDRETRFRRSFYFNSNIDGILRKLSYFHYLYLLSIKIKHFSCNLQL